MRITLLLLLCLLALAGPLCAADATALKAGVFEPPRMAPDFTLAGSDGAPLTLSDYRGKVVLLAFGFTSCPDVCPVTLATLAAAHEQLGAAAAGVQVVYVTVDPERDDAQRMRNYLAAFDPAFRGGTGTAEQLAAVRKDFGITSERQIQANGSVLFGHSAFTYLIDRGGRLVALMPYGSKPEAFVHDVGILLAAP